jgi:hypothetical protein
MRTAVLAVAALVASFVTVRALRSTARDGATTRSTSARPAPPAPGADDRSPRAPAIPPPRRPAPAPPPADLVASLRRDDPHAASVLFEGIDRAVFRILDRAWRRAQGSPAPEPAHCLAGGPPPPATVTVRLAIDSEPARLAIRAFAIVDDALPADARACLVAWLAGDATVTDEEIDGAFPALHAAHDVTIPLVLAAYLAP